MPRDDPRLHEALLVLLGHRVGEGAFEADQVRPDGGQARRGDAFALHAVAPVHQVGNADQDFLGIAPAQLAGSPEGVVIDNGHAPADLTAGIGDALGGRAGAQDNYINGCCRHGRSSCLFPSVRRAMCLVAPLKQDAGTGTAFQAGRESRGRSCMGA